MTAVCAATALVACTSDPTVSEFQNPRPWQTVKNEQAYEKLDYSAAVYDTGAGTAEDKRVKIAEGTASFTLEYGTQTGSPNDGATLDTSMSITYNEAAPQKDRGKTDTVTSSMTLLSNSLETLSMTKTVALADRDGERNNSYTLAADYSKGKATRTMHGKDKTLKIPDGKYWDNEFMYYLARTTGIKKGSSTTFYMTNLFDSFQNGEIEELTMAASADGKLTKLEFDDWIKPYVITKEQEDAEKEEQKKDEGGKTAQNAVGALNSDAGQTEGGEAVDAPYTVPCYNVSIIMTKDERGPAQIVYYSERPIEHNGLRHKKVPLKMTYALYENSKIAVLYEYTLTALSFVKQ